jgi:hypothetical protein
MRELSRTDQIIAGLFLGAVAYTVAVDETPEHKRKRELIIIGDTADKIFNPATIGIGLAVLGGVGMIAQGYFSKDTNKTALIIEKIPFSQIALMGSAIWAGDKIYKKVFGDDTTQSVAEWEKADSDIIDNAIAALVNGGMTTPHDDLFFQSVADTIYDLLKYKERDIFMNTARMDKVRDLLIALNNDLEVYKVIKAFGFKNDYILLFIPDGQPKWLPTFVNEFLGAQRIVAIHQAWAAKGIKYTFF